MTGLDRFREIRACDVEFRQPDGDRPAPACVVAREPRSGRVVRLAAGDPAGRSRPPFDVGPDALVVAYYASAELGCFLALAR